MAFGLNWGENGLITAFRILEAIGGAVSFPLLQLQEWQQQSYIYFHYRLVVPSVVIEVVPRCIASSIAVGRTLCY